MKIKKIDIENFRSVQEISIELKANLNVFVGVNGAGKTTLLDAISTMMSWFVNRIQRQNASGNYISDSDIRNDAPFSKIDITVTEKGRDFNWKLYKSSKGKNSSEKSLMNEVSELTFYFRDKLSEGSSLPVVAFYPVTRVVDKTMPEIKGKESLYILDAYDNALGGKRNYQSFFEWFRIQDDIVNEEAMSRSKWIEQNQTWIKKRIKKLLGLMKDTFKKDDLEVSSDEYKYLIKNFENDELIYKEPRFLFHELSRLIEMVGMRTRPDFRYEKIFRDLEYMFHKMEMYSTEYRDDLIDEGGRYEESILQIIRDFNHLFREDIMDNTPIKFIWETFVFANILSLWWMSERGKHEIEKQLRKYLPGVNQSEREWRSLSENLVGTLQEIIRSEIKQKKNAYKGEGKELKTVSKAIEQFVPEYSSLRVKRVPRPHMLINKGNDSFNLDQLSDGEKNLITLIGDIARRLAIANPNSKDPLKGDGIILIDEIDLHLHPSWQRLMIPGLTKVFPNCQFIITTHSPLVLSHVRPENIFLLKNENNELKYSGVLESFGKNADRILEDLLGVDARPIEEKKQLHELFRLIQNGEIEKAKGIIDKLRKLIGDDQELVKANVLIKRKQIIGK